MGDGGGAAAADASPLVDDAILLSCAENDDEDVDDDGAGRSIRRDDDDPLSTRYRRAIWNWKQSKILRTRIHHVEQYAQLTFIYLIIYILHILYNVRIFYE